MMTGFLKVERRASVWDFSREVRRPEVSMVLFHFFLFCLPDFLTVCTSSLIVEANIIGVES